MADLIAEVNAIVASCDERYGPFTSTHEGYGVLAEEVAELFEAVRANSLQATRREALQVAAVALRLARECDQGYESAFGQRSVK
jgi:NTP pyrophosphatase (non-canonical NTP hydrolase)